MDHEMQIKTCSKCGIEKPVTDFHRRMKSIDGLRCNCKACDKIYNDNWERKNPEKKRAKMKRWRDRHPDRLETYSREYYALHRERQKQRTRQYYALHREEILEDLFNYRKEHHDEIILLEREARRKNPDQAKARARRYRESHPEIILQRALAYAKKHPGERAATQNARYARQLKAMPSWANPEAIKAFYLEAARLTKESGITHSVDHIIPLQGKNICGFHHEGNLQIITKRENSVKGNSFPENGVCFDSAMTDGA
jgi:hypothetical protein